MDPDWQAQFERLEGAFAPSTIRCYLADVGDFVFWCESTACVPFPAEVDTVCRYLDERAMRLRAGTLQRRIYAIAKAHRLLKLADPTRDEEVAITIRRARRSRPCRPRQAKGLTQDYLSAFLKVQPDTPWGLRDRAMLSLGYDLLARRSELVAIESEDVTYLGDGTLRVLVRRSKADPFGMGRLAFSSIRSAELLAAWLEWRGPGIRPLFCGIYRGKPIDRALSGDSVKMLVKRSARMAGVNAADLHWFSGHSLRVGAAQDLLCRGLDTAAIMRAGGWKSVTVLARYLELAEHNVWMGPG